jgi:transposase
LVATLRKGGPGVIVIGVDPHKQHHTAAAVEQATGELRGQRTAKARQRGHGQLLTWARALERERPLRERELPAAMLAGPEREIALLLDYREDLDTECSRIQQRLRWHLHDLDPELKLPPGALERFCWLERVERSLDGFPALTQVAICRELVACCRELTCRCNALERELAELVETHAAPMLELPGLRRADGREARRRGCWRRPLRPRRQTGQARRRRASAGLLRQRQRHRLNRKGNRQLNCALHWLAVTQGRVRAPSRAYLTRKEVEGRAGAKALLCLKRHLAPTVSRMLRAVEEERMPIARLPALAPALTKGETRACFIVEAV